MSQIVLTKEEREKLNAGAHRQLSCIGCDIIAKEAVKKVGEWGNEECFEHPYNNSNQPEEEYNRKRHRCPKCWQTLLKAIE